MTYPKITIITVVFNAVKYLESTIRSVQDQKYKNIEFIIIDAGSSDGTIDIIKKYESLVSKWISEIDEGLYYAMNKGLKMATGEYVMFLNAGDMLYNDEVLSLIFTSSATEADIYYGETMIVDQQGKEIGLRRLKAPEKLKWREMKNGMVVCHQSVIVRRSITPFFDTRYRIASDYLWVLQSLKSAEGIVNTGTVISRFMDGGMNKSNIIRALKERFIIMIKEFGFFPAFFQHFIIAGRFVIYFLKHSRF